MGMVCACAQIIINILNNAVKFTERGYVKLSIKVEDKTEQDLVLAVSIKDRRIRHPRGRPEETFPVLLSG